MSISEFSDQFDVLYNNITSNQAPGLNEYEKSVFLTKAQEEIVKNYFSPKANPKGDGFDDSPKRQADFSTLIREGGMNQYSGSGFDKRTTTKRFFYPSDVFIVLNEQVYDSSGISYVVNPISFEEYDRLMKKPYKYPPKYQAWRLITSMISGGSTTTTIDVPGTAEATLDIEGYVGQIIGIVNTRTGGSVRLRVELENPEYPATNKVEIRNIGGGDYVVSFYVPIDESLGSFKTTYIDTNTTLPGIISSLTWPEGDSTFVYSSTPLCDITAPAQTTRTETVTTVSSPVVELIGRFNSTITYSIRYVKRPKPIVLVSLVDMGVSINGEQNTSQCELPESIHDEVLQRAVELAKIAWVGEPASTIQAGQRSE